MKKINWSSYKTILIAALIIRIIAAIFSKGYGMHDDHFLIVEASASWVDGYDYNHWLPWSPESTGMPEGHSFTYVGINFVFFYVMKFIGVTDPQLLMFINRLFHAMVSLLIVLYGIKITEKISDKKMAIQVGWILALLWMMPFLSVRNLVEITCIPFILSSVWFALRDKNKFDFLVAGLLIGFAVSIRYQVGVFALAFATIYFFKWEWKKFIHYCLGVVIVFSITQGLVDYFIWGYPFAEFYGYATYNANEGTTYIPNNNYFMYVLVMMGVLFIPLGLLVGFGFFRSAKKHFWLFLPTLAFVLFHSFYPSKQERFILPVFPIFLILGVTGYQLIKQTSFVQNLWKWSIRMFWILNIPILLIVSTAYSKKSRVESMYYFYESGEEAKKVLLEGTGGTGVSMPPKFYSGQWYMNFIDRSDTSKLLTVYPGYSYDYIIFYGDGKLDQRVNDYKSIYPEMELKKQCAPSTVDLFMRWLNPLNRNEYIEIWKTGAEPK